MRRLIASPIGACLLAPYADSALMSYSRLCEAYGRARRSVPAPALTASLDLFAEHAATLGLGSRAARGYFERARNDDR
jgi:hypothetical protein